MTDELDPTVTISPRLVAATWPPRPGYDPDLVDEQLEVHHGILALAARSAAENRPLVISLGDPIAE